MKGISSMIAALALALTWPVAASAAVGDPELILYRMTGVNTNSAASSLTCTPFSGVTETIRVVLRDVSGNLVSNQAFTVPHLVTLIFTTLAGGSTGSAAIAATSNQMICTASAGGISLRMIRFNPITGTTE